MGSSLESLEYLDRAGGSKVVAFHTLRALLLTAAALPLRAGCLGFSHKSMSIGRNLASLALLCVFSVSPLLAEDKSSAPSKPGGCVDVHSDASFASVGYDHIVTLKSGCKRAMTCTVTTNVNPEPALVELAPGEEQSVVTWRGSPAREFTPNVTCNETKRHAD
jgi:hypothetical protein